MDLFIKLEVLGNKNGVDLADINVELVANHLLDVDIGKAQRRLSMHYQLGNSSWSTWNGKFLHVSYKVLAV